MDGAWTVVTAQVRADFEDCVVSGVAGGRDLLVCERQTGAVYEGSLLSLYSVDFTKPDGERRTRVAQLGSNAWDIRCVGVPDVGSSEPPVGTWTKGIVDVRGGPLRAEDVDYDGRPDVTLEIERAHVPYSPSLLAKAKRRCAPLDVEGSLPLDGFLPKRRTFRLQFERNAEGLAPAKGTARLLARWNEQQAPLPYGW